MRPGRGLRLETRLRGKSCGRCANSLARADPNPARRENAIRVDFFVVEAFRASDVERAWEIRGRVTCRYPHLHENHNLATPTPLVGEERKPWTTNWGHGSSPSVHDGESISLVDRRQAAYIVAFNTESGRQEWFIDRGADRVSHGRRPSRAFRAANTPEVEPTNVRILRPAAPNRGA